MKQFFKRPANLLSFCAISLALLTTVILYQRLGRDFLFDWDEGIYAELGAEMLESGDWLIPTWNKEPWLEKPPGIAWVTAGSLALFGHSPFGARAFMPLFAFITLLSTYLIGRKLDRPVTGLIAMSLLSSFYLFLSRARGVNTDGALLAALTGSLALALHRAPPWILALTISLGVMFKGPAGLLTFLFLVPIFLLHHKKYFLLTTGYCLLALIPWHLYAYLKLGDNFLTPYLKEQLLRRVTTPIEFHIENRYFYLNYLWENLKAGVLFVAAVGAALLTREFWLKNRRSDFSLLLPLWWFVVTIGVFTFAKTRLFWYVLPVYPAIALMCAYAVTYFLRAPRSRLILVILTIGIIYKSLSLVASSVELNKLASPPSARLETIHYLAGLPEVITGNIYVPKIERVFMEIMPESQRLSSTFRYGGMPNILFYLGKPVRFFYTRDALRQFWDEQKEHPIVMFTKEDFKDIPEYSDILYENNEFIVAKRGELYVTIRDRQRSQGR